MTSFLVDESFGADELSHKIFSFLENRFLFGSSEKKHEKIDTGKVRILSIDAGGATDGVLAAKALVLLETRICEKCGNPGAGIADFFDVAAGSGVGGVLAALLFTKGKEGRPLFKAGEALELVVKWRLALTGAPSLLDRMLGSKAKDAKIRTFRRIFGEATLKDTLKPVLISCYDTSTSASFLFSRSDAFENDGYDFKMSDVCNATLSERRYKMSSVNNAKKVAAVGVGMKNPTAAAVTHVLNNKQEFPFCDGTEDLLVVSLGDGVSGLDSVPDFVKIGGEAASDTVDEAVSMAFGDAATSNYVRIQGNGCSSRKNQMETADEMLAQKNVESVLFRGKKVTEKTNSDKLSFFAEELVKEQGRRKTSLFPTVMFKQSSPRSSSATASTLSSC